MFPTHFRKSIDPRERPETYSISEHSPPLHLDGKKFSVWKNETIVERIVS